MMFWSVEVAVQAYDRFLGRAGLGAMPHSVSFPCCSQFAVTNVTVHLRSKFFWEQNLHYLKHNNIEHSNDYPKSYMVGKLPVPSFAIILPWHFQAIVVLWNMSCWGLSCCTLLQVISGRTFGQCSLGKAQIINWKFLIRSYFWRTATPNHPEKWTLKRLE